MIKGIVCQIKCDGINCKETTNVLCDIYVTSEPNVVGYDTHYDITSLPDGWSHAFSLKEREWPHRKPYGSHFCKNCSDAKNWYYE